MSKEDINNTVISVLKLEKRELEEVLEAARAEIEKLQEENKTLKERLADAEAKLMAPAKGSPEQEVTSGHGPCLTSIQETMLRT